MNQTVKLSHKQGQAGGKSWLGCFWLLSMCLEYPETRWFVGREELKRLRRSTLQTFFKVFTAYTVPQAYWRFNGQDHLLQFTNGSRIDLIELKYIPSDPLYERFGSEEYTGGWIEEAGEVHFGAFDTLKSRIGRQNNDHYGIPRKMLVTFNPKKNWLRSLFYLPWKSGDLPEDYAFIQALVDDEPDQLIAYEWIEQCQQTQPQAGPRKLGIDVARYGDDSTVFCRLHGNLLMELKRYTHQDIAQTAKKAQQYMQQHLIEPENTIIDTIGVGAGVYDNLKDTGLTCREFIAGGKPIEDDIQRQSKYQFADLRSQMWWYVREQLRTGVLCLTNISDYPQLLEDLTAPKYSIEREKVIRVEPKVKIKERIGRSTDDGDAFIQAVAAPRLQSTKQFWVV